MLRTWKPDDTNYFSLLPLDLRHLTANMTRRDLTTQIIRILYKPQPDWFDEYGNTEDWYAEVLEREIQEVFESHSISIKLDYKQAVGVVKITLQEHTIIPDQVIVDLILIRRQFTYYPADTPQLNMLLWRYAIPYRIVEYESETHHGCIDISFEIIPIS